MDNDLIVTLTWLFNQYHSDRKTIKGLLVIIALLVFLSVGLMWALADATELVW